LATEPIEREEYTSAPTIRQIITAPASSIGVRTTLLYGVAAALASLAPQPFGALAALCVAVLAAERKK
jgi:uncharacterized membrane protein YdfJ with MMPL/SSD domain